MSHFSTNIPPLLFFFLFLVKCIESFAAINMGEDKNEDIVALWETKSEKKVLHSTAQNTVIKNSSARVCQMLTENEDKNGSKNFEAPVELAKFKEVVEQIAENCAKSGNMIGGSAEMAEKLRQQLANSILGKNDVGKLEPNAFLAQPFHFMQNQQQFTKIHVSEENKGEGRRLLAIVHELVAKMPTDFGPKKTIENLLEKNEEMMEKVAKVPYLSLSTSLELFQLSWSQFFDGHGRPTRVMVQALRAGPQAAKIGNEIADHGEMNLIRGHRRVKRDANLIALGIMGAMATFMLPHVIKALGRIVKVAPVAIPIILMFIFVIMMHRV